MTYSFYTFHGSIDDLLKVGGPNPGNMAFTDAMDKAFQVWKEQTNAESQKITADDPWIALEIAKKSIREKNRESSFQAMHQKTALIVNKDKIITSYTVGYGKV